jgi:hypothetical protein
VNTPSRRRDGPLAQARQWPAAVASAGVSTAWDLAAAVSAVPARASTTVVDRLDRWVSRALPAVMESVLSRVDLTDLVTRHVDLNEIVATVDLNAIIRQMDLVGLAQYIIDEVDLAGIVRSSSTSVTTEAVHRLRAQGVDADEAVSRVIDRLIPRRHHVAKTPKPLPSTKPAFPGA